jgi:hypothetical protein
LAAWRCRTTDTTHRAWIENLARHPPRPRMGTFQRKAFASQPECAVRARCFDLDRTGLLDICLAVRVVSGRPARQLRPMTVVPTPARTARLGSRPPEQPSLPPRELGTRTRPGFTPTRAAYQAPGPRVPLSLVLVLLSTSRLGEGARRRLENEVDLTAIRDLSKWSRPPAAAAAAHSDLADRCCTTHSSGLHQ